MLTAPRRLPHQNSPNRVHSAARSGAVCVVVSVEAAHCRVSEVSVCFPMHLRQRGSDRLPVFPDEVDTAGHDGRRGCMLGAAQATRRLDGTDGQVRGPIERTTVLMAIIHGHAGLGISRRCFGRGTRAGTVEAP